MSSDDNFHAGALHPNKPPKPVQNSHSLGNISNLSALSTAAPSPTLADDLLLMRKKSRSREAINLGSHGLPISSGDIKLKLDENFAIPSKNDNASSSDVIFTVARPATVISSNAANAEAGVATAIGNKFQNVLYIKEDSPARGGGVRKSSNPISMLNKRKAVTDSLMQHPLPLLPDSKEVDWTRLVDNAIMQVNEGLKNSAAAAQANNNNNGDKHNAYEEHNLDLDNDTASTSSSSGVEAGQQSAMPTSTSLPELQNQVSQLEDRISKETRRRKSLEHAVRRLTDENRRLQDESQAAVQQLRRFTEWFFQTIDRQS